MPLSTDACPPSASRAPLRSAVPDWVEAELLSHLRAVERTMRRESGTIARACSLVVDTLRAGGKLLVCGNGGSAADAQHFAAELTGRFRCERRPYPALSLATDSSALTAIANDYGYEQVFARQVAALASPGDLLIGISTSGESPNIVQAFAQAGEVGCAKLGLLGQGGGAARALCDVAVVVPANDTARIQELHTTIGHILCEAVDRGLRS